MGLFGLGLIFAPAIGRTLSGWVIEHYDWRILFNGMVPLGLIVIGFAFFLLKDGLRKETKPQFDFWGAVTSSLGVGLLLYGLSEACDMLLNQPGGHCDTNQGHAFDNLPGLLLDRCLFYPQSCQRLGNAPQRTAWTRCNNAPPGRTPRHQGPGKNPPNV